MIHRLGIGHLPPVSLPCSSQTRGSAHTHARTYATEARTHTGCCKMYTDKTVATTCWASIEHGGCIVLGRGRKRARGIYRRPTDNGDRLLDLLSTYSRPTHGGGVGSRVRARARACPSRRHTHHPPPLTARPSTDKRKCAAGPKKAREGRKDPRYRLRTTITDNNDETR